MKKVNCAIVRIVESNIAANISKCYLESFDNLTIATDYQPESALVYYRNDNNGNIVEIVRELCDISVNQMDKFNRLFTLGQDNPNAGEEIISTTEFGNKKLPQKYLDIFHLGRQNPIVAA